MKLTASLPLAIGTLAGLLLLAAPAAHVHAGCAVATDGHGGYGFAYGDYPMGELRHRAVRNCCEKSRHPDDVRVVFNTGEKGHGTVLRYRVNGEQHIATSGGASSLRAARRSAARFVEENGGGENWEEVDSWEDN